MDNNDNGNYPLVNIQKAIEAMAIEIVSFPINSMVIFHSFLLVYQRVLVPSINGNFRILKWRYCTICLAICCEDIP